MIKPNDNLPGPKSQYSDSHMPMVNDSNEYFLRSALCSFRKQNPESKFQFATVRKP
ncbi:hypothetical protein RchiOBHm_Chr4g0387031 [Rosa chinensis]|uniref:Uncharacterized protein n=1 Tax=Rosa chinensis TaxID=74649 RepID=A0A2P6QPF1_ROSCH|nr:hypothetical protein RchiOBHm_Chr4g0387031 [Rosa chinensis]